MQWRERGGSRGGAREKRERGEAGGAFGGFGRGPEPSERGTGLPSRLLVMSLSLLLFFHFFLGTSPVP